MKRKEIRKIIKASKDKDDIYFDCFDTLIQRKYSTTYVFYKLAEYLIQNCHLILSLEETYYSLINIFNRLDVPFERLAKDVYLHYQLDSYISFDTFLKDFKNVFIVSEMENIAPTINAKELIDELKKMGKHIFVISDFYLDKKEIERFIIKVFGDNPFEDIFVSCDVGTDKASGGIYKKIIRKSSSLMIGDNLTLDSIIPEKEGIPSVHIDSSKNYKRYNKFDNEFFKTQKRNIIRYRNKDQKTYAANQAFMFYDFCKRLYANLKKGDVVFFLARDGQFLKECFDLYLTKDNYKNIQTEYFPISRLAMLLPTLDVSTTSKSEFIHLFNAHSGWQITSFSSFLSYLGFENSDIEKVSEDSGISREKTYFDFFNSQDFDILWENKLFRTILKENSLEAKNKFQSELLKKLKSNRLIIADIGWKGSTQNDIRKILPSDIILYGYYLGTTQCIGEMEDSYKIGLLFDYSNNKNFNGASFNCESLLRTDKGQLVCYKKEQDLYFQDNGIKVFEMYAKERQDIALKIFAQIMKYDSVFPVSKFSFEESEKYIQRKEGYFSLVRTFYFNNYQNNNDINYKPTKEDYFLALKSFLKQRFPWLVEVAKDILAK